MTDAKMPFEHYADALFNIELPDGNTIRLPETGARAMWESGKSLEEIAEMASITDSEGEPYLSDPFDLYFVLRSGASPSTVRGMLDITDEEGNLLEFEPDDLSSFLSHGGTRESAEQLFRLTDSRGIGIFDGDSISRFTHYGGTVEEALELASLTDTKGNTVFSEGEDIANYRYVCKDLPPARSAAGLKDSSGRSVFSDGADLVTWLYSGGSSEQAEQYLSITGADGRAAFDGHDLALLQRHGVPADYAAAMAAQGMNALTAIYYHKIGYNHEDTGFARDGRPRALLLFPTGDYFSMGDSTFTSGVTIDLIKEIEQSYDIRLRAISSVSEMCSEIEATPDVRLLLLAGHGNRTRLCFGMSRPKYGIRIPERERHLKASSQEAAPYFAMLPARATIFLNSCLTGKGCESGRNLANSVAGWAPGRRVISSTESFATFDIEVETYCPLELRILGDEDGEGLCDDYTYVARKAPARRARGKRGRR